MWRNVTASNFSHRLARSSFFGLSQPSLKKISRSSNKQKIDSDFDFFLSNR